jgi:hypothetical protein
MIAIVLFMAVVVLLDGLALLFDPSLYRKCMEYVEEEMGSAWMVANALAFVGPGATFLIQAVSSRAPILSALVGCLSVLIGVFFALASTVRFAYLGGWWRCRSNAHYQIAGIACIVLCLSMLLLAGELPRA